MVCMATCNTGAIEATTNGAVMAILFCLCYVYYVNYVCAGYSAATQKRHKTKSRFQVLNMQKGLTFIVIFRGEVEGTHIPLAIPTTTFVTN